MHLCLAIGDKIKGPAAGCWVARDSSSAKVSRPTTTTTWAFWCCPLPVHCTACFVKMRGHKIFKFSFLLHNPSNELYENGKVNYFITTIFEWKILKNRFGAKVKNEFPVVLNRFLVADNEGSDSVISRTTIDCLNQCWNNNSLKFRPQLSLVIDKYTNRSIYENSLPSMFAGVHLA